MQVGATFEGVGAAFQPVEEFLKPIAASVRPVEGLRKRDITIQNAAGQTVLDPYASDCLRRAAANRMVRWTFDDDFDVDSPMTVLSLDELKWLKNGQYTIGEDGQGITPWRNFLETCGQDFLVAWWFISGGWYHSNPRSCGAVWKRAA